MLTEMRETNDGILRPEDVNAACREGDEAALEIIRNCGAMIGEVLASLVNVFNPSHIFIGGGVTNFGNHFVIGDSTSNFKEVVAIGHHSTYRSTFHTGDEVSGSMER